MQCVVWRALGGLASQYKLVIWLCRHFCELEGCNTSKFGKYGNVACDNAGQSLIIKLSAVLFQLLLASPLRQ